MKTQILKILEYSTSKACLINSTAAAPLAVFASKTNCSSGFSAICSSLIVEGGKIYFIFNYKKSQQYQKLFTLYIDPTFYEEKFSDINFRRQR